ncbi:MAG: PspA/IM30 family protein [SAR202 cluster bacterium]|nr:PspA/IM30 family protein [SAR202 cluster bacterium]
MGILARTSTLMRAKMNRLLDRAENPSETLDVAYDKQIEMLRNVKRGVVEMVSTKRRLELQAGKVQDNISKLDAQARQAMDMGREDMARLALERKQHAITELQDLDQQISGLELEQEKLTKAEQRLQAKVQAFRTKKEIIKAQYKAAQAQVRIGSALSGISEEMGDITLSVERAEDKTEALRAKSGAIDELAESGVLNMDIDGKDDISRELDKLSANAEVENELAALKASVSEKKSLPEGQS